MTSDSSARPVKRGLQPDEAPSSWWRNKRLRLPLVAVAVLGAAIAVLAVIFVQSSSGKGSAASGLAGRYPFQVGSPGPGDMAQPIRLPSTDGTAFDLGSLHGQTVLLFFQEGVGCEPCWDQIKDIEKNFGQFQALGVDKFVSITTDPLATLKQKVADERITTPVLADGNGIVSKSYQANRYGMMGDQMDGHSFILLNKDGIVTWRADYGGAPKYTMYMPVSNLLADMSKGLMAGSVKAGQ